MHHTQFVDELRERGHRITPQREVILSVVCDSNGHVTADEILKRVRERYPYMNKSAVYRTLDLMAQLSLINPTDFGKGRVEYEIHRHPHHHHLVCRNCHSMTQVDEGVFAPLAKVLQSEYGFVAALDHFAIYGLCRKCSGKLQKHITRGGSHAHP